MKAREVSNRAGMLLGIFSTVALIGKVHARYIGEYDLTTSNRLNWMIGYSILCFVIGYAFGLPEQATWPARIKAATAASLVSAISISALQFVFAQIALPRFVIAVSMPSLIVAYSIISFIVTFSNKSAATSERILLITSAQFDAVQLKSDVAFHTEIPCVIAEILTVEKLRLLPDFNQYVRDHSINLIVLGVGADTDPVVIKAVTAAHLLGVRIRTLLSFYREWVGKIPVRELGMTALLFDIREIHHIGYARVSRMIDITISMIGLIALVIVTPIVVIGNIAGNRGPLLYGQERVGKGQSTFRILKFRSMVPGVSTGEWTKKNDSRITRFGKFLRLSHFDEIPQVINILRGDLSIVGPRPEQKHYVTQLAKTIPYYESRHMVRPGLTGWAQVNYPYGADEIDALEKLQYEFWYLQHQSLWLDLKIIARTARHVLGFKGR